MRGARWVTVAFLVVGVLNYLYALVLTHLLDVAQYSAFAAGQGLLLWATTVATVSVPWVLAQALARAGSDAERFAATRFTMLASTGSGLVAGAVVWVIAVQFASTPAALASRDLWHRALGIAAVQGLVSLFAAIDVVFVAALPESRALAASYQVSAALSRAPLFVAGAVSTAFFPVLARSAGGGTLAARAVRMYAVVALPLATILATTPAPVLAAVFPAQYGAMATLLKFTAVAGLAAGGINMLATFFQAVSDYSCAWWLLAGLAGYVTALLAGWAADGITGLAVGSVLGATAALGL